MDVLRTSSIAEGANDPIQFYWDTTNPTEQFYIYMHFVEVEKLQTNQSREFNIYINGFLWNDEPFVPGYLSVTTFYSRGPKTGETRYRVIINRTESSTLPPIISGYEIYTAKNFSNLGTNETDGMFATKFEFC